MVWGKMTNSDHYLGPLNTPQSNETLTGNEITARKNITSRGFNVQT